MVFVPSLLLFALSASAAPMLNKRIDQVTADSTTKWEAACTAAGGGTQCNNIAVQQCFPSLLAAAGPCDQQNAADAMVDLAKQLNNDADMITFAQIFAQQPRNSPTSQMVPYCQQAPKNAELTGAFQCQFSGTSATEFVGGVAVGGAGTIPFGQTQAVNPRGSCPANPNGPVPDGEQLTDITSDPGNVGTGAASSGSGSGSASSSAAAAAPPPSATSAAAATASAAPTTVDNSGSGGNAASASASASAAAPPPPPATTSTAAAAASSSSTSSSGDFQLQNGKDAQKLNASFQDISASDSCSEGSMACVTQNGTSGFAQCVNGQWAITQCAGGLQCFALPLVAKPGTSITCDSQADALARIAATGATGGLTGSSSN